MGRGELVVRHAAGFDDEDTGIAVDPRDVAERLHDESAVHEVEVGKANTMTKIVERSDVDIWELGAEVMETLLVRSGVEKAEIDGLILSASMTGAGNPFWSQSTAEFLGLELNFCQTVDIGGSSLPAVRVELDPTALFNYGIGLEGIRAALASANANSPKG